MINTLLIKFSLEILLFIFVFISACNIIYWMMWDAIDYTLKTLIYLIYYDNLWAIVPSTILWVMS